MFAAARRGTPVLITDPAAPPAGGPADAGARRLPPETFLVVVTSGTSGHPRPVLRTAASWTSSFAPFSELTGIGPGDRVLLTGPLHATMHLFAAVHTLAIGAHLVDDPAIATAVHAVPSRLATLLDELDRGAGRAPLHTVVVAGAPLPDELAARALARGLAVVEYYGAAELSFVAARRAPGPLRPFPGARVELRSGVLWVSSPYLSLGYPPGISGPFRRAADGFATVGDLAEDRSAPDDPAGPALRIRGRGDAAITTGGATVVAEDVEQVLLALPGVAAVAVVGAAHPRLGQLVVAVLEPVAGADLGGIRAAARRVLTGPSRPRRWLVADALPRTPG
ncbi:AMP-binding protein, partial [Nakamurella sp.]|uniref:AMP-binding protein n=1 Tax=Nakamurella sp. TaxID=1869182 RepID=UPI003B3B99D2